MHQKFLVLLLLICLISQSLSQFVFKGCFQQIGIVTEEIINIAQNVSQKNTTIQTFLTKTYNIVKNVDPLFKSCGLNVRYLNKTQEWGPKNSENCFNNIAQIYDGIAKVYQSYQSGGNSFQLMGPIGNLVSLINTTKIDCHPTHFEQNHILLQYSLEETYELLKQDSSKCLNENSSLAMASVQVAMNIANKDINGTISSTIKILKDLPKVLLNCGQQKIYEKIKVFESIDFDDCDQDLKELIAHVMELINNIKSKGYFALLSNAQGIYNEIKDLNTHCRKNNNIVALMLGKVN
ncbi:hypothetical protein IMG5_154660 [Ichthyophthirius multifiliis]|uniref:Transmembrane protein n=1 Tax=Ichthyophthirius multifiliis TaxID=5932 RepID=G0QZ60_ICHMU|nr:hypothetical protein IMG5_154660 [Ichthyophthirius multifiliis]EGR29483.1 hypothetical protein IMG5_154660 [Ichthyophthirius multifiliis]|eukprot:XP_004030719.1 hypothetical protein IMG5_154660 [Ichthyophthirius multifiliis]